MSAHVLFRDVRLLDLDAEDGMTGPTDLRVRDGRIATIGPQPITDAMGVIDGRVMLDLINAHLHTSETPMKGRRPVYRAMPDRAVADDVGSERKFGMGLA